MATISASRTSPANDSATARWTVFVDDLDMAADVDVDVVGIVLDTLVSTAVVRTELVARLAVTAINTADDFNFRLNLSFNVEF